MAPAKQQRKRAAIGEEASAASEERGEDKPKRMGRPPKNVDRWDDDLGEYILKDGSVYKRRGSVKRPPGAPKKGCIVVFDDDGKPKYVPDPGVPVVGPNPRGRPPIGGVIVYDADGTSAWSVLSEDEARGTQPSAAKQQKALKIAPSAKQQAASSSGSSAPSAKQQAASSSGSSGRECAICLEEVQEGEEDVLRCAGSTCNHIIHAICKPDAAVWWKGRRLGERYIRTIGFILNLP